MLQRLLLTSSLLWGFGSTSVWSRWSNIKVQETPAATSFEPNTTPIIMNDNASSSSLSWSTSDCWSTLASPMSEIFLEHVVPDFLSVEEFVGLSAVSRRFRQVFGRPTTNNHNDNKKKKNHPHQHHQAQSTSNGSSSNCFLYDKILATLLQREGQTTARCYSDDQPLFGTSEQLPTLGNDASPEISLRRNAWGVAQLRRAALRRRRLIRIDHHPILQQLSERIKHLEEQQRAETINEDKTNNENDELPQLKDKLSQYTNAVTVLLSNLVYHQCKALPPATIAQTRLQHELPVRDDSCSTDFICINHTPWPIYCHWIDSRGDVVARDGDCIEPYPQHGDNHGDDHDGTAGGRQPQTRSFELHLSRSLRNVLQTTPPYIFKHSSSASHSFALSWTTEAVQTDSNWQPFSSCFAVYQQRRCWDRILGNSGHAHAIVISCRSVENAAQPAAAAVAAANTQVDTSSGENLYTVHKRDVDIQEVHFSSYSQRGVGGTLVQLYGQVDRETGQLLHPIHRQAEHPPPRRGRGQGGQQETPATRPPPNNRRPCMVDDIGLIQLDHSLAVNSRQHHPHPSALATQQGFEGEEEEEEDQALLLARRFYGTHIPLFQQSGNDEVSPQWKQGPAAIARMLLRGQERLLDDETAQSHGLTPAFVERIRALSSHAAREQQRHVSQQLAGQPQQQQSATNEGSPTDDNPISVLVASPLDFPNPLGEALFPCYNAEDEWGWSRLKL